MSLLEGLSLDSKRLPFCCISAGFQFQNTVVLPVERFILMTLVKGPLYYFIALVHDELMDGVF